MAKVPVMRGWPKGMNNMAPEYAMPEGTLRDATNVDILDDGRVRSRKGFKATPVFSGSGIHSLFEHRGLVLAVSGGNLVKLSPNWASSVVQAGVGASRVSYVGLNDEVIWANGEQTGRVSLDGVARPLGVEVPASIPSVSSGGTGTLPAGLYHVAVTFLNSQGEESGTGQCAVVEVGNDESISVSGIPQPRTADVTEVRVYASEPNGTIPYHAVTLGAGASSCTLQAQIIKGRQLDTQFCAQFPPCEQLEVHGGRLWGVIGSALVFSDPLVYGRYRPGATILYFPAQIVVLKSVDDGLYVVADRTYFLAGREPGKQPLREVLPYGAVPGTAFRMPGSKTVGWFSSRGFVLAAPGGEVRNLSEENIAPEHFAGGVAAVREQDGLRQLVTSMERGGTPNGLAVQDYAEGTVIRGLRRIEETGVHALRLSDVVSTEIIPGP